MHFILVSLTETSRLLAVRGRWLPFGVGAIGAIGAIGIYLIPCLNF
jgi:hypothetical protein